MITDTVRQGCEVQMKLVTFQHRAAARPGIWLDNGQVLDLEAAFTTARDRGIVSEQAPWSGSTPSVHALIAAGERMVPALLVLRERALEGVLPDALVPASDARLLAPIPRPAKNIFCVGRNYFEHVAEGYRARGLELKVPEHPQFFTKPPTAVIGPDAPVPLDPSVTERLDYEVELAVVIGRTGLDIPPDQAFDHVFGYTIINDVTARDLQRRHDQWFKGKGLDGSCPMGPWIVHRDALPNPQDLEISLTVNGEERQRARTSQMIFDLPRIISDLSRGMTLEAGDIIATGTPSGVGYAMDPPRLLAPGDIMECKIEGIGILKNEIALKPRSP